jgi:hypothetical protein
MSSTGFTRFPCEPAGSGATGGSSCPAISDTSIPFPRTAPRALLWFPHRLGRAPSRMETDRRLRGWPERPLERKVQATPNRCACAQFGGAAGTMYFLAGAGGWRLQIVHTDAGRPGRQTVSSGLVLIGVQTEDELAALHCRLRAAGLDEDDGYRDPDGRIVMVRLFDPS